MASSTNVAAARRKDSPIANVICLVGILSVSAGVGMALFREVGVSVWLGLSIAGVFLVGALGLHLAVIGLGRTRRDSGAQANAGGRSSLGVDSGTSASRGGVTGPITERASPLSATGERGAGETGAEPKEARQHGALEFVDERGADRPKAERPKADRAGAGRTAKPAGPSGSSGGEKGPAQGDRDDATSQGEAGSVEDLIQQLAAELAGEPQRPGQPKGAEGVQAGDGARGTGPSLSAESARSNRAATIAQELSPIPPDGGDPLVADDVDLRDLVRSAAETGSVELHVAPIVDLKERRGGYHEVATRLRSASGSLIFPSDFLPIAEELGVLGRIDLAATSRAVVAANELRRQGKRACFFSQISRQALTDDFFVSELTKLAEQGGGDVEDVILQINHRDLAKGGEAELAGMRKLARLGFKFALDAVTDPRVAHKAIEGRNFAFIKIPAAAFLAGLGEGAKRFGGKEIVRRVSKAGLKLIVTDIDTDRTLAQLESYDVALGQGRQIGEPQPVSLSGSREESKAA